MITLIADGMPLNVECPAHSLDAGLLAWQASGLAALCRQPISISNHLFGFTFSDSINIGSTFLGSNSPVVTKSVVPSPVVDAQITHTIISSPVIVLPSVSSQLQSH